MSDDYVLVPRVAAQFAQELIAERMSGAPNIELMWYDFDRALSATPPAPTTQAREALADLRKHLFFIYEGISEGATSHETANKFRSATARAVELADALHSRLVGISAALSAPAPKGERAVAEPSWEPDICVDESASIPAEEWDKAKIVLAPKERDCPVCSGDCAAANPPVLNCPLSARDE